MEALTLLAVVGAIVMLLGLACLVAAAVVEEGKNHEDLDDEVLNPGFGIALILLFMGGMLLLVAFAGSEHPPINLLGPN